MLPATVAAQVRRDTTAKRDTAGVRRPGPGDTLRTRRDSAAIRDSLLRRGLTPGDTTRRELVKWAPTDSVMDDMMKRRGYAATRYQGDTVYFRADKRTINMLGRPSAVEREQTVM